MVSCLSAGDTNFGNKQLKKGIIFMVEKFKIQTIGYIKKLIKGNELKMEVEDTSFEIVHIKNRI